MNIFRVMRPELTDYTLKFYGKEVRILKKEFDLEDEYDLTMAIVDISIEEMNLSALLMSADKKYKKQVRLAVFRNLINIFENDITAKNKEILDLLILEERFKMD